MQGGGKRLFGALRSQRHRRAAGLPAWSGTTATTPRLCGHSWWLLCRGGEMSITQRPGSPLEPTVAVVGGGGQGARKAPCKIEGNLPGGPFNWPAPEWAGCGISIILCGGVGMWKPDPTPCCGGWWRGTHSPEWRGWGGHQTCLAGLPCGVRRGPTRHTPRLQTPELWPPLPKPETRGLTSKLTLDTLVRVHRLPRASTGQTMPHKHGCHGVASQTTHSKPGAKNKRRTFLLNEN